MTMNVSMPKKFLLGALLVTALSAGTVSHAATVTTDAINPCTRVGGAVSLGASATCDFKPDTYSTTVFQVGLCPSAPTAPTTAAAAGLGACTVVYNNPAGSAVSVTSGGAPATLSGGTLTVPPGGTYTHGYVLLSNSISMSTSVTFTAAKTGQAGAVGVVCWTVNAPNLLRSDNFATKTTSQCGASVGSVGTQTVRFDTMLGDTTINGVNAPFYSVISTIPDTGDRLEAYLLEPSGVSLADSTASTGVANRILGIVRFASAVTVSAQATNVDVGFRTSSAAGLDTGAGATPTVRFDPGPFVIKITAQ